MFFYLSAEVYETWSAIWSTASTNLLTIRGSVVLPNVHVGLLLQKDIFKLAYL